MIGYARMVPVHQRGHRHTQSYFVVTFCYSAKTVCWGEGGYRIFLGWQDVLMTLHLVFQIDNDMNRAFYLLLFLISPFSSPSSGYPPPYCPVGSH